MKLNKVEWRNFASYGNKIQSIEFDKDKSNLYLLVGENGAGKSTISDVIIFGLYGKIDGKKLKDLPNRVNGNLWVRITFESNNSIYVVERGLEPSVFNVEVDGIQYDKAGIRSVQDFLMDAIEIPHYVFGNTLSLSINDFKSFLKMTPADKKAIIDKIFGFYIINMMKDLLKQESKSIKENLIRLDADIATVTRSINSGLLEMETLMEKLKENSEVQIEELRTKLDKFKKLYEFHKENVSTFLSKETEIREESRKIMGLISETKSSIGSINEKLRLYSNDKCPECHSDLKTIYHQDLKTSLESQREELQKQLADYNTLYQGSRERESEISQEKAKLNEKGGKISNQISSLESEIRRISSFKGNEEANSLQRIIENLRTDLQSHSEQRVSEEKKSGWVKKLEDVLGDKGVKQLAIRSILPSLNANIAELMESLHLPYEVVFDEDFDATVFHLGQEISISTLSTGQMKKVDFAVLLSVLKLMKIRFSSINLLFLDEIFSSIDSDGIYTILNTLRKICDDFGLNVFVINHAPMPLEIFDYNVSLSIKNNFSDMIIDKV